MILQVLENWMWLQRTQWYNPKQLIEIQDRKLKNAFEHAYRNVPFYRKLYDSAAISPSSIRNAENVTKLPIVSRETLLNTPLKERTAVNADITSCRVQTSSGTSGSRLTVLEDPYSAAYRDALNLRFLWAYGVRPFTKVCRLFGWPSEAGNPRSTTRLADQKGLWATIRARTAKFQLTPPFDDSVIKKHIEVLSAWKPEVLMAMTYYCKALARVAEISGKSISFKVVVTSGELLDESARKLISNKFNAEVFDHYGIEEVGSIAWECPTHSGYHVNAESCILEFLRDGEPVAAGENGEVQITSFHKKATPIIRYSVGDIATSPSPDNDCSCGRNLPLVKNIQGRIIDFIVTKEGHRIAPGAVIYHLENSYGVDQFKVTQRKDFSIEVLLTTHEVADPVIRDAEQRCRMLFGDLPYTVRIVERIGNPKAAKLRMVESRLGSDFS